MTETGWSSVPNWVIRTDKLHGTEKWVYITLLNRANSKGECWPSLATLQKEVGVSKNTVLKTLKSLEEKGLIDRVRRRTSTDEYVSNLYRVHTWEGSSETALGGSNENQGVVHPLNKGGSNESHEVLPTEVLPNRSTTQGGGNGDESPPSPFCKRHEATDGTDHPCRGCKIAGQKYEAFMSEQASPERPFAHEHKWFPDGTCLTCDERREVA